MAQIDDWVAALHASLGRAADIFLNPVKEPDGTKTKVYFQLKETLTPEIAAGTHEGGIVELNTDQIEIECKATDIPENIVVSVKNMNIGDVLHAGDIKLPEGMKLVTQSDILVVSCHMVAAAKSTEEMEMEMPSAPEVIGEDKESEEAETE